MNAPKIVPADHIQVKSAPQGAEFAMMSKSNSFVQLFVKYGDGSGSTPHPDHLYFFGAHDNWQPVITKPEDFVNNNTFCTFEITA